MLTTHQQHSTVRQHMQPRAGPREETHRPGVAPRVSTVAAFVLPELAGLALHLILHTVDSEDVPRACFADRGLAEATGGGVALRHDNRLGPRRTLVVTDEQHGRDGQCCGGATPVLKASERPGPSIAVIREADGAAAEERGRGARVRARERSVGRVEEEVVLQRPSQAVVGAPHPRGALVGVGGHNVGLRTLIPSLNGVARSALRLHFPNDFVRGEVAADDAVAEVDQAQLLAAAGSHLRGAAQVPRSPSVVAADDGDDRLRVRVVEGARDWGLAQREQQLIALQPDHVRKCAVCRRIEEDVALTQDLRLLELERGLGQRAASACCGAAAHGDEVSRDAVDAAAPRGLHRGRRSSSSTEADALLHRRAPPPRRTRCYFKSLPARVNKIGKIENRGKVLKLSDKLNLTRPFTAREKNRPVI